eukprot:CAMPEP_0169478002 /NCGR_PEP_ID=MMETSP1042-20121227/28232_1 /TAXON_ID=464988 /ORGANISM="Hemiselmis andersenii, Strain CCMP1180" /LENGTH=119 /DNA_ID=CAMNT_0009592419 /DNA_START=65 /DNA_END=421 /DNA_ORIENTATION=+
MCTSSTTKHPSSARRPSRNSVQSIECAFSMVQMDSSGHASPRISKGGFSAPEQCATTLTLSLSKSPLKYSALSVTSEMYGSTTTTLFLCRKRARATLQRTSFPHQSEHCTPMTSSLSPR